MSLFAPIDGWLAPAPAKGKVDWLYGATFAHRGLHGPAAVENSPSAFAGALAKGYGIECDIQCARDGTPMVFHDWDLDRLTRETGPVAGRDAAQLGAIPLTGSDDCIPTLRQFLDQVAGRVPLLIEVKSKRDMHVGGVCDAVHRDLHGYTAAYAVMSFDPRVSRWFADHAPQTVRGLVVTEANETGVSGRLRRRCALWHARPDFLAYDITNLPSGFAAEQRGRGLPVTTWTVRSPELLKRAGAYADAPIAEAGGIA